MVDLFQTWDQVGSRMNLLNLAEGDNLHISPTPLPQFWVEGMCQKCSQSNLYTANRTDSTSGVGSKLVRTDQYRPLPGLKFKLQIFLVEIQTDGRNQPSARVPDIGMCPNLVLTQGEEVFFDVCSSVLASPGKLVRYWCRAANPACRIYPAGNRYLPVIRYPTSTKYPAGMQILSLFSLNFPYKTHKRN